MTADDKECQHRYKSHFTCTKCGWDPESAMTTDDTAIRVPRHLVETLLAAVQAWEDDGFLKRVLYAIDAIVALLPPPKRWTEEDVELVARQIAGDQTREDAIAVLTALDEAGRLKEVTDES